MPRPNTYEINPAYFSCIDTPNKAYWLGALAADGCVYWHQNKWVFQLMVAEKDQDWLLAFRSAIGSSHPIRTLLGGFGTPCRKLLITNQILCQSLLSIGYKSDDILERVPEHLWCHFIRGLFDGDGSIRMDKGKPRHTGYVPQTLVWKLTSQSDLLLKSIQRVFERYCDITPSKMYFGNNAWQLAVRGNRQVKRIAQYIYPDGDYAFLARKREKFTV
jgi:hypothetical protein